MSFSYNGSYARGVIASDSTDVLSSFLQADTVAHGSKVNYELDLFGLDSLLAENDRELFDYTDSLFYGLDTTEQGELLAMEQDTTASSANFLDSPIYIEFTDSLVYVPATKDVFIHANGNVKYEDKELTSDYMSMNTTTKIINARGVEVPVEMPVEGGDTTEISRVVFVDGGANYDMDSMYYNMGSGKALIYGVDTKDGEGILYGGTVKKMQDNVTHMHNGRYTTCDADCPHFYLQMSKATVVPGEYTVFGPAYLVFEDVPVPLGVPFGFFPQKTDRNSGIIIPEIGEERVKGFYLRNLGYYFAINDYVDMRLTGSIYTLGSWDLNMASNYALRYKFSGSFNIGYSNDIIGEPDATDFVNSQGYRVMWSHRQDPKFSPSSTFSASVDFTTNTTYNKYNADNMQDYLSSQSSSAISYSKNWEGTPFSLSASANYSQNFRDSTVSVVLPNFAFNMSRISPFKRLNAVGKERWYEKISMTYRLDFQNKIDNYAQDKIFSAEMFDDLKMGVRHTIPVSASFNIGGVFNISPSVNYNERWYFNRVDQLWDPDAEQVMMDTVSGFYRLSDYSVSLSMDTKLYGTYTLGSTENGKKPMIFRHVMSPNLSLSWAPDFSQPNFGYWQTVQVDNEGTLREYSPYSNGMFGTVSGTGSGTLGFGLQNTVEAKIPSDADTSGYEKIKIIDDLSFRGSYNFLADSMNLSTISASLRFPVPFTNGYNVQIAATFDPYALNSEGQRINKYLIEQGGFLRLTSMNFSLNFGLKSKETTRGSSGPGSGPPAVNDPDNKTALNSAIDRQNEFFLEQAEALDQPVSPLQRAQLAAGQYYNFAIPWSLDLRYNFSYSNTNGTPNVVQTIDASASLNLTPKWGMSFSAGYDLQMKTLTPGTVQITRDLHCWQMSFSWTPVGFRTGWSFTIQAKSAMLADLLKWDKNSSYLDNYYY